ncbi:GAF domain-containing protein [Nocardiopsis sp. N85]|uniref:GAF domain-containing protein n=1 Tax=Nocardiopsis sp. N85 TaxID=3029400 RepID=UPI00237EF41C|nr:GAF domain-containing protein [Nocardiopsis sp. N85]MDE3722515.1 GAF domain-containing protein [Nocardiopsis sp. N85]
MTGTWNAWPWEADPDAVRKDVARAHEDFTGSGRVRDTVRSVVIESWRRSARLGIDPDGVAPRIELSGDSLTDYRDAHPLAVAMPLLRRLLLDTAPGPQIVALGDASGRLLWVEGDHRLRTRAEDMRFVEGANWHERSAGTNAPGVALALDHEVQVFASEHFARSVQPWSCSAAPLHDPDTGALLGVLDITGEDGVASPQALALVRVAAAAVEMELRARRIAGLIPDPRRIPQESDPIPDHLLLEVLGRDGARLNLGERVVELSARHSEILLLLSSAPRGLTGAALGVRLNERDASPVTVRAEMSRLRRLVGPGLVASRPYRLLRRLPTDVDTVRERLTGGDHLGALRAYRGPVLPVSEAPGVIEIREGLDAELCGALGAENDPRTLLAWAEHPEWRDDPRVLGVVLRSLDPASARHAALRGRLRWLGE